MKTIQLTQRQARLLRDNLTFNKGGYDYLDLIRLDHLANKLTELQGQYGVTMAEMAREEKRLKRAWASANTETEVATCERHLIALGYEVEELNDAASGVKVEFTVEDGDYNLIRDKVEGVTEWAANDDLRPIVLSMLAAIKDAIDEEGNSVADSGKLRQLRKKR